MKSLKHILSLGVIIIFVGLFIASASTSAVYSPPVQNNSKQQFSKVINKPYDDVWNELINYSASAFFGIDNFEKESGLLTLSFGASNPEEYITGGYCEVEVSSIAVNRNFKGDYVKYNSLYHNGNLVGKINIVLKKINDSSTKIIVNAKYVYTRTIPVSDGITTSSNTTTWSFNSGNCANAVVLYQLKKLPSNITICPTYKVEKAILDAVD